MLTASEEPGAGHVELSKISWRHLRLSHVHAVSLRVWWLHPLTGSDQSTSEPAIAQRSLPQSGPGKGRDIKRHPHNLGGSQKGGFQDGGCSRTEIASKSPSLQCYPDRRKPWFLIFMDLKGRNEGTFATTALLQYRPFASSREFFQNCNTFSVLFFGGWIGGGHFCIFRHFEGFSVWRCLGTWKGDEAILAQRSCNGPTKTYLCNSSDLSRYQASSGQA